MDEIGELDEAGHLAELAAQCREKASNMSPSFSRTKHLRRAEFLEQAAREKADISETPSPSAAGETAAI